MLLLYSSTLFVSAALLFLIQPMVAKMILPSLGGTSSVWTVCMLFFQTILLMGYLYAQLTISRLGVLRQSIMHSLIILIPVAVLPAIASLSAWSPMCGCRFLCSPPPLRCYRHGLPIRLTRQRKTLISSTGQVILAVASGYWRILS